MLRRALCSSQLEPAGAPSLRLPLPFLADAVPIGTMNRSTGTLKSLKESALYEPTNSWANWRVAVEGKPAEGRRKYRGGGQ